MADQQIGRGSGDEEDQERRRMQAVMMGKFTNRESLRSTMSAADFKCQVGGGLQDDTGFGEQSIITVVSNVTKTSDRSDGSLGGTETMEGLSDGKSTCDNLQVPEGGTIGEETKAKECGIGAGTDTEDVDQQEERRQSRAKKGKEQTRRLRREITKEQELEQAGKEFRRQREEEEKQEELGRQVWINKRDKERAQIRRETEAEDTLLWEKARKRKQKEEEEENREKLREAKEVMRKKENREKNQKKQAEAKQEKERRERSRQVAVFTETERRERQRSGVKEENERKERARSEINRHTPTSVRVSNKNTTGDDDKNEEEERRERKMSRESGKFLSDSSSGEDWGIKKGMNPMKGRMGKGNGGVMGRINKPTPFNGKKEGWRRYKGLFLNWAKAAGIEKSSVINSLLTFLSSEDFEKVDSLNLTRGERADPELAFKRIYNVLRVPYSIMGCQLELGNQVLVQLRKDIERMEQGIDNKDWSLMREITDQRNLRKCRRRMEKKHTNVIVLCNRNVFIAILILI